MKWINYYGDERGPVPGYVRVDALTYSGEEYYTVRANYLNWEKVTLWRKSSVFRILINWVASFYARK